MGMELIPLLWGTVNTDLSVNVDVYISGVTLKCSPDELKPCRF